MKNFPQSSQKWVLTKVRFDDNLCVHTIQWKHPNCNLSYFFDELIDIFQIFNILLLFCKEMPQLLQSVVSSSFKTSFL